MSIFIIVTNLGSCSSKGNTSQPKEGFPVSAIPLHSPITSELDSLLSQFEILLNNDVDSAKQEAYALSKGQDAILRFLGYYHLSRVFSATNDIEQEGMSIDSLAVLSQQLPDTLFQGLYLLAKAGLEYKMERNGQAILLLGKSIELLKNVRSYRFRVIALRNMANIYLDLQNFAEAEKYFQMVIQIAAENNDKHLLAHFYSEMSTFFEDFGDDKKAWSYLRQSDSLNQFVGSNLLRSINLGKHADRYKNAKKYPLALRTFKESLNIARDLKNTNFMALYSFKIGEVYVQSKNFKKAIFYFNNSLDAAEQVGNLDLQKANYRLLSDIYRKSGQWQTAMDYLSALNEVEKAIFNTQQHLIAQRFAYKFESQKKQEEINTLKIENKLKNLRQQQLITEKKQQKMRFFSLLLVAILLIILAVIIIYNLRQKAQKEQLLFQKNKELHVEKIQQMKNISQVKTLNAMLHGQEKERERIARDLHDSLGGTLSTLQLHIQNLDLPPTLQYIEQLLAKACTDVREISHNMMPVSLKKMGLHAAIQDFINHINAAQKVTAEFHSYGTEINFTASRQLYIFRLIQEGINNALKHAQCSHILVQFVYKENHLNITIEDDGIGFDPADVDPSFGLKNLQNRIGYLQGQFEIDSSPGRGTVLMFEVPGNFK